LLNGITFKLKMGQGKASFVSFSRERRRRKHFFDLRDAFVIWFLTCYLTQSKVKKNKGSFHHLDGG